MSSTTTNLNLVKPDSTDFYDIDVFNSNADLIDAAVASKANATDLANKVDKVNGKGLSTNDYTDTDKTKLSGIEDGATKPLVFTNKTVATTDFVADATYTDYGYKAVIACTGVTSSYVPTVNFDVVDAESGIFAPVALTGSGTVTIYASEVPSANITIPSIMCIKGA